MQRLAASLISLQVLWISNLAAPVACVGFPDQCADTAGCSVEACLLHVAGVYLWQQRLQGLGQACEELHSSKAQC